MEIPSNFILSIKPKGYLTQGLSHCGAYSVKAILSAYRLDKITHPKDYHPVWIGKLTGLTLGKNYPADFFHSDGKINIFNQPQINIKAADFHCFFPPESHILS